MCSRLSFKASRLGAFDLSFKKLVTSYKCFQSQHHRTSRQVKIHGFRQRKATASCPAVFSQQWSSFLLFRFFFNRTFIIFMIKICVTLNEGQGQYNSVVMHFHIWGNSPCGVWWWWLQLFLRNRLRGTHTTNRQTLVSSILSYFIVVLKIKRDKCAYWSNCCYSVLLLTRLQVSFL